MKNLVLGIGNTLLSDEGVGIHAIQYLQTHYPCPDTDYIDGGTLSFTLAGPIEDSQRLIVIDAAELDASPGTVRVFAGEAMDHFLGSNNKRSVHEVGLIDLMSIARLANHLPGQRALVGIQPEYVNWGERPSPAVEAAIPLACEKVIELIGAWQ